MEKEFKLNEVSFHNKINDCWIVINDRVYDITNFLDEHPGGKNIILKYAGLDATQEFDRIGHSSISIKYLNKMVIGRIKNSKVNLIRNIEKKNKIKNLFTHEDKLGPFRHIHKILGVICLVHFIFRFIKIFKKNSFTQKYDPLFLNKVNYHYYNLFFIPILFHALLSYSSLIFNVPKKQSSKPMIWQEFRAHNILFASRSILSCIVHMLYFKNYYNYEYLKYLKATILLLTFKGANIITKKLRIDSKESTTRTLPYWNECPYWLENFFKYFYMYSQYAASLGCLGDHESAFSALLPIQLASFLMTLTKKNIINTKTYHIIYFLSLVITMLITFNINGFIFVYLPTFIMIFLKVKLRLSKYVIWITLLSYYLFSDPKITFLTFFITIFLFERSKKRNKDFLYHRNQIKKVKLLSKIQLTHDTWELTFSYPENKKFGLKLGEHIIIYSDNPNIKNKWNNKYDFEDEKIIKRQYTPIKINDGKFILAIKEYKKNKEYPDGGKVSQKITNLNIGEEIKIAGPFGYNTYLGNGNFLVNDKLINNKNIFMICAGTGITAMYSILNNILENDNDLTSIKMINVNKTFSDIMLKDKLDNLISIYKKQFKIYYFLTREKNKIKKNYFYGRPNKKDIRTVCSSNNDSTYLICGDVFFINSMNTYLQEIKISQNNIIIF